jgi:predicted NBD/HSP70 family sugar kinase
MKVGENVLLRRAGRLPGGGPPAIAEVIAAARDGEARAAAAVDEVAEWCGVGLRGIVNLFNPEIVVLGGVLSQVWSAAGSRVDEAMSRSTLISPRNDVEIRSAGLEDDSPLIGAAELAFAPILAHPQMVPQAV